MYLKNIMREHVCAESNMAKFEQKKEMSAG
jgi:hypothetical protein